MLCRLPARCCDDSLGTLTVGRSPYSPIMTDDHGGQAHPRITGEAGELVDLFMRLIDRESETDPHWWFNYGQMVLFRFSRGFIGEEMQRTEAMAAVREVLMDAITTGGIRENFLISALKADLDSFVRNREDPAQFNERADLMRARMQEVIEDPESRARWQSAMAKVDPKYAAWTEDQLIEDAKRALEDSMLTRHVSADDALTRWSGGAEWWSRSNELLPDTAFEHWERLNIRRMAQGD